MNTLFTVVHHAASFSMPDEHLDLLAHLLHQQGLIFVLSVRIFSTDPEKHLLASKPEVRWYCVEESG